MTVHGMLEQGAARSSAPADQAPAEPGPEDQGPEDQGPEEYVVLVDPTGRPIGRATKREVHSTRTPLHLAFSLYVFDAEDNVLLTRRALSKKTWPGVWTNTCCGHPAPGESLEHAARRRVGDELGLAVTDLRCVLPDFAYTAVDASGIRENEVCPVFVARVATPPEARAVPGAPGTGLHPDGRLQPNPAEVVEWSWIPWHLAVRSILGTPFAFSPWAVEQVRQLDQRPARSSVARPDRVEPTGTQP